MVNLYKLHSIARTNSNNPVIGITVPKEVSQHFSGCYFKVEIKKVNGQYGFFCASGSMVKITKEEIEKYNFEDVRL